MIDLREWADLHGEELIYSDDEPQEKPTCPDCGQPAIDEDFEGYCESCWWLRNGCEDCQFPKFQCRCKESEK